MVRASKRKRIHNPIQRFATSGQPHLSDAAFLMLQVLNRPLLLQRNAAIE